MLGMRATPDPYGGFRFPATNALRKMLAAARLQVHLDEVLSGPGQAPSRCQQVMLDPQPIARVKCLDDETGTALARKDVFEHEDIHIMVLY
jgi:hypothetical protein